MRIWHLYKTCVHIISPHNQKELYIYQLILITLFMILISTSHNNNYKGKKNQTPKKCFNFSKFHLNLTHQWTCSDLQRTSMIQSCYNHCLEPEFDCKSHRRALKEILSLFKHNWCPKMLNFSSSLESSPSLFLISIFSSFCSSNGRGTGTGTRTDGTEFDKLQKL